MKYIMICLLMAYNVIAMNGSKKCKQLNEALTGTQHVDVINDVGDVETSYKLIFRKFTPNQFDLTVTSVDGVLLFQNLEASLKVLSDKTCHLIVESKDFSIDLKTLSIDLTVFGKWLVDAHFINERDQIFYSFREELDLF